MKMKFTTDDRGVSEVIGAILVFGLLVLLMAIMQMQAVPAANQEVEFNHNQDVQSDLVKFQEAGSRTVSQGTTESTRIRMGTTYPSRMLFFNPNSPSGTIRTVGVDNASIRNVESSDPNINKYFVDRGGNLENLETKRVEYEPNYNEYDDAPTTVLEYGTLYRNFSDTQLVENQGSIVNGNSISLTFYDGELSRSTGSTLSLESRPASAPVRTVPIESQGSGNIEIRLESRLSEERWEEEILANETAPDGNVVGVTKSGDTVVIELDGSKKYTLQMAKIGLGSSIPNEKPKYVAPTGGSGPSVIGIQSTTLPFEVRDRYNNPARNEDVNITVSQGSFSNGNNVVEATTNDQGKPNVGYTASTAGLVTVNASFKGVPPGPGVTTSYNFDPANDPADLQFRMSVDPSQDTANPTIRSGTSAERTDYTVCGSQGLLGSLSCTVGANRLQYSQITVDYDLEDTGHAGLDSMKVEVTDSNGQVLLTDVQAVSGPTETGTYRSPQIFIGGGTPTDVNLILRDKAGNSVSQNYDVS